MDAIVQHKIEPRGRAASSRRRSTFILIAVFWLLTIAILSVRGALIDSPPLLVMTPRRFVVAAFGILLCLGMVSMLAALRARSFAERIALGVAGALLMAVLLSIFAMLLNRVIAPLPEGRPVDVIESAQWVMVWFGYCLAWVGTHLALTYHWEAEDQLRHGAQMTELAHEARVAALRYQINPHFLFNTLNSISSLVLEKRNDDAELMLLNLSTFLRSTLAADPRGTIDLGQEIALQRLYLAIEEARFAERMRVEIDVPDGLLTAAVPSLILQPLVENAIRYGVGPSEGLTTVRIAAERRGGNLRLVVEDNGTGSGKALSGGTGLGLGNVRERLRTHFGDRAGLVARRLDGRGFRAEISLPWILQR